MKRITLMLLAILFLASGSQADFSARHLTDPNYYWNTFQLKQLSCQVDVKGLFYETTIEFEIGLWPDWYNKLPRAGSYEITWDFGLPTDAVITDCQLKPANSNQYIAAEIVDLTTAEELYSKSPTSKPRQLLRHRWQRWWDGSVQKRFQMKYSPVDYSPNMTVKTPVIKISYLTPCIASYDLRRIFLPLYEFNVYRMSPATIRVYDLDNPTNPPYQITGFNYNLQWAMVNGYWQTSYSTNYFYSPCILAIVAETANRSYLRIFSTDDAQFYQLSVLPPIPPENRNHKNILLTIDVTEEGENKLAYEHLIDVFEKSVHLSTSKYDSITMIYSGFTTLFYDTTFVPVTYTNLQNIFKTIKKADKPKLNTLPQILRQAVKFFNKQHKAGEIWLLTNARAHSNPLTTAMEIIDQSLNEAENPLVFRIINNDAQYWPSQWINYQRYYGNDYLYENLARLSWGSYVKLRDVPEYDALDLMLDCIAPTATTVETDPEPVDGLTYSRFQLNRGRLNFPITMPYYEIGLFDGSEPFNLHFYGMVDRELYSQDVLINRQTDDAGLPDVATFWFACYIQEKLKEPQSYETIKYIEQISVDQRLLTPYSGFIIPGPDGVCAFQRLADATVAVEEPEESSTEQPERFTLSAYPNPFNPETTISCELPLDVAADEVTIKIVNCLGQTIQSFKMALNNQSSTIKIHWDGKDTWGQAVASGVYIVSVAIGHQLQNLKITLMR